MNPKKFDNYSLKSDNFAKDIPNIKLDDLSPRHDGEIKLSIMISTYNRGAQLERCLETLCRQEFREFEVLVNDDGSTQDIKGIIDKFYPYLNVKYFFTERPKWVSCPSSAFKMLLEYCKGDVISVTHPEMMFHNEATYYMYYGAFTEFSGLGVMYSHLNNFDIDKPKEDDWLWVTFKPLYVDKDIYFGMNMVDWHSNIHELQKISGFSKAIGLSNKPNSFHRTNIRHPWWFVGAARRDCPIWDEIPVFRGHAKIDMWFLTYRHYNKIVDCNPLEFLCYHQAHATSAVGPSDDNDAHIWKV